MATRSSGGRTTTRKPASGRKSTAARKPAARSAAASKRKPATGARTRPKRSSTPAREPLIGARTRTLAPIVVVVSLALAVLGGLAVLPARTWLSQRENMSEARSELEHIEAEVTVLEAELELLQTDDEIERMARANFDLVYPGEESYRILPADD